MSKFGSEPPKPRCFPPARNLLYRHRPELPIPQGIAAWDVIAFTVPEGAAGCQVSLAVQTGDTVSNIGSIAVTADGAACLDLSAITAGDSVDLSGTVKFGLITLYRLATKTALQSVSIDTTVDTGAAVFTQVDLGANPAVVYSQALSQLGGTPGTCTVTIGRSDAFIDSGTNSGSGPQNVLLDAGPAINIKGSNGTKQLTRSSDGAYGGAFATIINTSLPGLPPIASGGSPFLEPGAFTADNGGGGADIGPFSINLNNPKALVWENMDQIAAVDRAQGVTVTWSGGDPDGLVRIAGTATQLVDGVALSGLFLCTERVSAGQFTVPAFVTHNLPQVTDALGAASQGTLLLTEIIAQYVTIPGVDLSTYISSSSTGKSVTYQ